MALSSSDIRNAAEQIGVEPCAVKAVVDVESGGDGFLPDGRVKILFEGHVFWKELQKRGINPGRTTIIGIIGAGKASRALIRLRNGKIVTVRLGDRIDGGTINSIGDGRITYVKSGRTHELRMLDGR